jgi:thiamine biosynthesis lipoprotein
MTAAAVARALHVEHCMGTVFTVDIRDPGQWDRAVNDVIAWLRRVDAVFSTYKPDSDVSRLRRGDLHLAAADPDVATVLDLCAEVQATTGGYFTAMSDGRVDPTGLVKGWAIELASELLRQHGSRNHAVNGGGDVQLAGESAPGRPWTVGISDPHDRTRVLTTISGRDFAVATSGSAERGAHIVDPFTERPATALAGATVVGPSLTLADAYATATFVMGRSATTWINSVDGYETLLVDSDRTVYASSGWPFS